MRLTWTRERPALWTEERRGLVAAAAPGSLPVMDQAPGSPAPGDWWRVERDGELVGYGWMDVVWGDAEILLVVAPSAQGSGVGTFIVGKLEDEARSQGLNHIYNTVLPGHPERQKVMGWLMKRGFSGGGDHQQLRRVVRQSGD